MKTYAILILHLLVFTACDRGAARDNELGAAIARALADACPYGDNPADERARNTCADKLVALPSDLRDVWSDPFVWGGQSPTASYSLAKGTTRLNARNWRKAYLSTFMFGGNAELERVSGRTIVHIPVRFRGAMPAGAYPYPFWHAARKWDSYNYSTTILLMIEDGKAIGALRALEQDPTRPKVSHAWDGSWKWQDEEGRPMPYTSLYGYLLSKNNPHGDRLDAAYRELEAAMREHRCLTCHGPDNKGHADQLELLAYPNQALAGRHDIEAQIADSQMPPERDGIPSGISDPAEQDRLIRLARAFAAAGDQALAWEDTQGL